MHLQPLSHEHLLVFRAEAQEDIDLNIFLVNTFSAKNPSA